MLVGREFITRAVSSISNWRRNEGIRLALSRCRPWCRRGHPHAIKERSPIKEGLCTRRFGLWKWSVEVRGRHDLHAANIIVNPLAFWADGKRFYLRGIDYQPGGAAANEDPLADSSVCLRDIKNFKDLGVNTIRVYAVDNSKDHDDCMNALADAGIYLVLDVNNPGYSINRLSPGPSYNTMYLQSVFATVEMFAKYDNTLAFFSGNEVINDEAGTDKSAPYVKAVTRDMKNYMNSRGLRKVPVGYSAADVSSNRMQTAMYMNCGSDDERSDFFAFNDYSWCNSDFKTSGWDQKVKNFTDYGIPILYVDKTLTHLLL